VARLEGNRCRQARLAADTRADEIGRLRPRSNHLSTARAARVGRHRARQYGDKTAAGVGIGRSFAKIIAEANPDVTIGLIPAAVGGSPIDAWKPGFYYQPTQSHPWDDAMRRVHHAFPDDHDMMRNEFFPSVAKNGHGENSRQGRCTQQDGSAPRNTPASTAGQHHGGDGKSFRNLVQKDGDKNDPPQPTGNNETRRDCNAVKEGVNDKADQHGISPVAVNEGVFVSLLSEMKMRCDCMLEQVNDEISDQNQERSGFPTQLQAGWKYLDDGRCQHESSAQGHKIFEVGTVPVLLDDDRAPKNIGRCRCEAEQNAEENRVHVAAAMISVPCSGSPRTVTQPA